MKRILSVTLALIFTLSLCSCGTGDNAASSSGSKSESSAVSEQASYEASSDIIPSDAASVESEAEVDESNKPDEPASAESTASVTESELTQENSNDTGNRILIAYFSHTGENYSVGVITKGNTAKVAEEIAAQTGGDLFEIVTVKDYPSSYDECTAVALDEQGENARPELKTSIDDISKYDTIYLGYPIWWGDLPMAVYTFLESYDFSGKTIHPFATHEGSGMSGTESSIRSVCTGATVTDGLAMRGSTAQNDAAEVKSQVAAFID